MSIVEKLSEISHVDATKGFKFFKSIFDSIDYPNDLKCEEYIHDSKMGRQYYLVRISKDNWHPSEIVYEFGNVSKFNPHRDINIHIEPQFDVLNQKLNLYLHYEINKYMTKAKCESSLVSTDYKEYLNQRSMFIKKFRDLNLPNVGGKRGSNQFGKIIWSDVEQITLENFNERFRQDLKLISESIDVIMNDMNI